MFTNNELCSYPYVNGWTNRQILSKLKHNG